jgi:hypothetical protein
VDVAVVVININMKELHLNQCHLEYSAIIVIERVHVAFVLIDIMRN